MSKKNLSKEQILAKVSSYDIMNYFLRDMHKYGAKLPKGKNFQNPLDGRMQQTPSFNIYESEVTGDCLFLDFKTGDKGDCFELVKRLFDLTFPEALRKIEKDIKLIIEYAGVDEHIPSAPKPEKEPITKSHVIHDRKFTKLELDYWHSYGIDYKTLKRFRVRSVSKFIATTKAGKHYSGVSSTDAFIFAYDFGEWQKIYRPLGEKNRRFLYLGQKTEGYIFGYDQLPEKGLIVFITGGEKDTMSLAAHGYDAISLNSETAMPDKKLIKELESRYRCVAVLYDTDKTGMKQSAAIAKAHNLPRVILPEIPNNGKDISDFFAEGGDVEEFEKVIIEAIERWEETPTPNKDYVSAYELLNMPEEEKCYLWEPFLKHKGLASLTGTSDSGKSAFCRHLSIAVATKQSEFLGFKLNPKKPCVYFVSSEDDDTSTSMLLKMHLKGKNYPDDLYKNLCFFFDCEGLIKKLDAALTEQPACLVIMDSFGDFLNGKDINANSQIRGLLKKYSELAEKHGCVILFIHHVGKRTEGNGPNKHNAIGSQAFEAKMRIVLELGTNDEGQKLLSVVKANYLGKEYKKASFVLEFDEDTLTFSMTDERVDFHELSNKEGGRKKKVIDWYMIFGTDIKLKKGEICKRLFNTYQMPHGTASRYISEELENVGYGYYSIPKTKTDTEIPSEE